MSKRQHLGILSAGLLAVSLGITGSLAFMTTTQAKENVFLIGDDFGTGDTSKITLTEPNWKESLAQDVVANQTLKKDPTVTNNSDIPVYAFIVVDEPLITVDSKTTPLFSYSLNSGWIALATSETTDTKTTVYAYATNLAMTTLSPTSSTTLFDSVTTASFPSGNAVQGTDQTITVKSYVIQTQGLKSNYPQDVWQVVLGQGVNA
jgi:hypothetical protein